MQVLLGLFATIAAIAAGLIAWWIKNNPRIRLRELNERIVRLEDDQRDALSKHDMQRVSRNNLALKRLRDIQTALAGK